MKILLDTHIVLWAITDDPRLSADAKGWLKNGTNDIYYSIISVWEVAIKRQTKRGRMPLNDEEFVNYAEKTGMTCLGVTKEHIALLKTLTLKQSAKEHHDPFDRILICQAKSENLMLMTHDDALQGYGEPCVLIL